MHSETLKFDLKMSVQNC